MDINGTWWTHGSDLNIIYCYRPRREKNRDHPVEPTQFCCWDQLQTTNDVGPILYWLVVEPTHLKNMLVKLGSFPQVGFKIKKYLKPPPSILVSEEFVFSHDFLKLAWIRIKSCLRFNDHHTGDTKIRWFYTDLLSHWIISYSLLLWELFGFFVPQSCLDVPWRKLGSKVRISGL